MVSIGITRKKTRKSRNTKPNQGRFLTPKKNEKRRFLTCKKEPMKQPKKVIDYDSFKKRLPSFLGTVSLYLEAALLNLCHRPSCRQVVLLVDV